MLFFVSNSPLYDGAVDELRRCKGLAEALLARCDDVSRALSDVPERLDRMHDGDMPPSIATNTLCSLPDSLLDALLCRLRPEQIAATAPGGAVDRRRLSRLFGGLDVETFGFYSVATAVIDLVRTHDAAVVGSHVAPAGAAHDQLPTSRAIQKTYMQLMRFVLRATSAWEVYARAHWGIGERRASRRATAAAAGAHLSGRGRGDLGGVPNAWRYDGLP